MSIEFRGRREDARLLRGAGHYTADWSLPDQAHARFVRADHAHARIVSVDATAARAMPGVVAVLIGADVADAGFGTNSPGIGFPGRDGKPIIVPDRPLLARDRVRFVGEEIALVIAESAEIAQDAAEAVEVTLDPLPVAASLAAALAPDAPLVHDAVPGNVCFDYEYGDADAVVAAMADADRIVRVVVDSPRLAPHPMEPRAVVATYADSSDTYRIRCSHQGAGAMRAGLAEMLGVTPDRIVVHDVDVGGAFGPRAAAYPEYALLLHAAKRVGRPVTWTSTRSEEFMIDSHGRGIRIEGELGLDSEGRFLALRTHWLCDEGAYLTSAGALTNTINGMLMAGGPYLTGAIHGRHRLVMTNAAPTNAYRGASRPEAAYIIERLVDEAAHELGIDPIDLRLKNTIPRDRFPYTTPTGSVFDSGDLAHLLTRARSAAGWDSFAARRDEARRRGRLRGLGVAAFLEPAGGGLSPVDQVAVQFTGDGADIFMVAKSSGQGHETVFCDLLADWLGVAPDRVRLRACDPAGPALKGSATMASRTMMVQGSGLRLASDEIIRKARDLAASHLEVAVEDIDFADGVYTVRGTDRRVTMDEIVRRHAGDDPHPLDTTAEVPLFRTFPSGAHIAEVEIDPETGTLVVDRYIAVDDVGTVINQVLTEGQLHGGIAQGVGQVLGEHCVYDEDGQLLTGSLMDYALPRADMMPTPVIADGSVPSPTNVLGAKGAGEAGTTGSIPTLMNAVMSALRQGGVAHFDMPATPSRLWLALRADGSEGD